MSIETTKSPGAAEFLTSDELAVRLGMSVLALRPWVRRGAIPGAVRVGRVWRFRRLDIDAFLRSLPTALFEWVDGRLRPIDQRKGKPKSKEELRKRAATRAVRRQEAIRYREWVWGVGREAAANKRWGADKVAAFRAFLSVLEARTKAMKTQRNKAPLPLP